MNKDYKTRNAILGLNNDDKLWFGGIQKFSNLSLDKLQNLIAQEFIDLDENQNCSPTTKEFLNLMKKYPCITAHGYAVHHQREDYGIILEGLKYDGNTTKQMVLDFRTLCHYADDFIATKKKIYCWYD